MPGLPFAFCVEFNKVRFIVNIIHIPGLRVRGEDKTLEFIAEILERKENREEKISSLHFSRSEIDYKALQTTSIRLIAEKGLCII